MQHHLFTEYICQPEAKLLQQYQLANAEALWHFKGDWFEPPNHERGGWSGVNYVVLVDEGGASHGFYLKRQEGHMRKTWRHPIQGEPTFVREFKILQFLNAYNKISPEKQVITPQCVFFVQQKNQSILLTKALEGYVAADRWLKNNANAPIKKQRMLMQALALSVKNLHLARVQHRALYLKHLFVKETENSFAVALIDFEKSRITHLIHFFKWMDLIKLFQRAGQVSTKNRLRFLKKYLDIKHLSCWQRCLWWWMNSKK